MAVDTVFGRSGDIVALVDDYATFYLPLTSGATIPIGGLPGQVLTKRTGSDLDVDWETPAPYVPEYVAEAVANKIAAFGPEPTDVQYPSALLVKTALDTKLNQNVAVVAATYTKITYDVNGLVVGGVDATTVDIADSFDKRYVTDAQRTALLDLSGINTGDQDLSPYALASGLETTDSNLAALSGSLVDYALVADLAATNIALTDVTASLANYALVSDLATTNTTIGDLATAVADGYTPIDQFNTLQASFDTLVADLNDPDFVVETAFEAKLTFASGLTRDGDTITSDVVTVPVGPLTFLGNASSDVFPASFVQIAAEYLSNGVTGTGLVVLDGSPTITTPVFVGPATVKLSDSGVSTSPTVLVVEHDFVGGGSIVPGFGATIEFRGRSTTTSGRTQGAIRTLWSDPTDGALKSNIVFSPVSGDVAVDSFWLHDDGGAALGANGGSGNGVLWLQGGIQMPTSLPEGQVLRSDGTGTFIPARLALTDVYGQFGSTIGVLTSTYDQTAAVEFPHFSVNITNPYSGIGTSMLNGTTWRVYAWGTIDNGTTAINFTPTLRWGGSGGTVILNTPVIVGTTTAQTDKVWSLEYLVMISSAGKCRAVCTNRNHTVQTTGAITMEEVAATDVTIDTISDTTMVLTWTISVATGTPHVRTLGAVAELVTRPDIAV